MRPDTYRTRGLPVTAAVVTGDPSRQGAWARVQRLLAMRLDAMGDVLMTGPALRAAKRAAGGRHVTLLTSPAGAEAARLVPDVDEVIVHEAPWVKATPERANAATDRELIGRLAAMRFDAAAIFTVYSQNPLPAAMVCWLADIPLRLAHCRENPYQLLTDRIEEPEPSPVVRHEVRRQLDLVRAVGWWNADERMRISIPDAARRRQAERVAMLRLPTAGSRADRRWAVLHPGATAPSRRYPGEHYAAVVHELASVHGWRFLLTGTEKERPLLERIAAAAPHGHVALASDLSVAELAALIEAAPLLISNNTGPVHLAASVGTPVVDLYALTNLQHTPWQVPSRVLFNDVPCRCCYKSVCPEGHQRCLAAVPPGRVVSAALELAESEPDDQTPDFPAQVAALHEPAGRLAAPSGVCCQQLPTTVPRRDVHTAHVPGRDGTAVSRQG